MKRLLSLAAAAVLALGLVHWLGLRDDVAVLSGSRVASPIGGVLYALIYFAVVLGAPVAVLGAAGLWLVGSCRTLLNALGTTGA